MCACVVCIGATKGGFEFGCRKFIGLIDYTSFSGLHKGQLIICYRGKMQITAYTQLFMHWLSWSKKIHGTSLLVLLKDDLEIEDGARWTFMSDEHEGIIDVIKLKTPQAEHRHCAWHIVKFQESKKERAQQQSLSEYYWICARSSFYKDWVWVLNE